MSKKGKKDYLSDRNKPEKSSKSPPADNDNMDVDASDESNEKSISDKINQKMRERRSQDGPTLGLSSLNLYGPENESLQTKKIQEKNKSKNISKGIRQITPKKSSNTQTSKSPINVSKNIAKSSFPCEKESESHNQEIVNAENNSFENQVDELPDSSACDEIESKIDIDRPDIITTRCTAKRNDSLDAILAQIEKQGMEDETSKTENNDHQKINLDGLKKLHAEVKITKNPSQLNSGTEQNIQDQSTDLPAENIPEHSSPASRESSSPSSRASSPPPPPSRESSVNSSHSQESDKSSKRSHSRSYSKTPSPRSPPESESINPPIFSENPPEVDQEELEDNEMESLADNNDLDELNNEEGSDNETSAIEADSTSSAGNYFIHIFVIKKIRPFQLLFLKFLKHFN